MDNQKVKFSVNGGIVYATIKEVHKADFEFNGINIKANEKATIAVIELPTGQRDTKPVLALEIITEAEFNNGIKEIIKDLGKLINADVFNETLRTEWTAEKATLTEQINKFKTDYQAANDTIKALQAKVDGFEIKSRAAKRMDEMKALKAFDGDLDAAVAKFGTLADDVYAIILDMAKTMAAKCDVQETQTSLPKSTEQTQTTLPKSTDQTKSAADETVASATINPDEKDADLSKVPAVTAAEDLLRTAIAKAYLGEKSSK